MKNIEEEDDIQIGNTIGIYEIVDRTPNVVVVRNINTNKTITLPIEILQQMIHNTEVEFETEKQTLENLKFKANDRLERTDFFDTTTTKKKEKKKNDDPFNDHFYPR